MERNKPDQRPVCKFFVQGYCKYQNKCHNYHPPPQNKKVCFDFRETGFCKYGDKCYFAHVAKNSSKEYSFSNDKPLTKFQNQQNAISNSDSKTPNISKLLAKEGETNNKETNGQNKEKSDKDKPEEKKEFHKHRHFIDFSKTELGHEIFEKNKDLWGSDITYFDYVRTLKREKDIELCQIQRKFQSSFMWISDFKAETQTKAFQIRYCPTIKREQMELDFEIEEGYFWLEFIIQWDNYPEQNSFQINLINNSIPSPFKKAFSVYFKKICDENKSIFKTLRHIDNSLDKICQELTKKKTKVVEDTWTQDQQSALEKAIVKYRSITNSVEKWNAIASEVPDKDSEACIARFKECRERALKAKTLEKKEETESEEEESSEEEEESGEESSENEQNEAEHSSEEEEEEEKFESVKEKSLEGEYNVYLNMVIKVNELKIKQIGVINIEEAVTLVRCQKCKDEVEKKLRKHNEYPDYLINDVLCANCNTSGVILLKKAFLHAGSNGLGRMGSNTWEILDILTVNLNAVCETCNHSQIHEKYIVGANQNSNCHSCFKEVGFSYSSYSLTFEEYTEVIKKKPQKAKVPTEEAKRTKIKKVEILNF